MVKAKVKAKKRAFSKRTVSLLLSLMLVFSLFAVSTLSVSAATTLTASGRAVVVEALKEPIQGYPTLKIGQPTYVDENGKEVKYNLFTRDTNTFTFNADKFSKTTPELQQAVLSSLARELNDSNTKISSADRNKLYSEIKNNCDSATASMIGVLFEDSKADLFTALQMFNPFSGVVGTILGCGVLALIILLLGSTVLDLCYIGLPVARNFIHSRSEQNGKGSDEKPWGVTNDAWSVIQETETNNTSSGGRYKNAYVMYFKRRVITYIILSICILYLLSGQIAGLIGWLMNLVSGFSIG